MKQFKFAVSEVAVTDRLCEIAVADRLCETTHLVVSTSLSIKEERKLACWLKGGLQESSTSARIRLRQSSAVCPEILHPYRATWEE